MTEATRLVDSGAWCERESFARVSRGPNYTPGVSAETVGSGHVRMNKFRSALSGRFVSRPKQRRPFS